MTASMAFLGRTSGWMGRRRNARLWLARASLLAFALVFPIVDATTRRAPVTGRTLVGWIGSALFWWALGSATVPWQPRARGRHVALAIRIVLSVTHGSLAASQLFALRYFGAPLGAQSLAAARAAWGDVVRVLSELRTTLAVALALASALSFTLLMLARGQRRALLPAQNLRWMPAAACMLLSFVCFAFGKLPPDMQLLSGLPALRGDRGAPQGMAHVVHVPELPSKRTRLPDVLLVITESVRDSDFCSAPTTSCPTAPELNAFAADRIGLSELRSLASYTTIAVGALLTGREQMGDHAHLASMPLLFDYVKAIRGEDGSRYFVAYYGAQISSSVFERGSIQSATDRMVDLQDLVGHPVEDEDQVLDALPDHLLEARVSRELADLPGPRFVVLHLLGTHAPYAVDAARSPFRPYRRAASFAHMDELHNAYKNAMVAQDADLTKMLRAFADSEKNRPWLLFYTSDHGEAFGEHGAIHHGQNLYPEQVHVPGFVVSRNGALSPEALSALRAHASEPLTHADVVPTLLDAMGVWSAVAMLPYRREMVGQSLLAPFTRPRTPIAVTNCNGSFKCPLDNWGLLGEQAALVAQAWDPGWRCITLSGNGTPDPSACSELGQLSRTRFRLLPNGEENK